MSSQARVAADVHGLGMAWAGWRAWRGPRCQGGRWAPWYRPVRTARASSWRISVLWRL